ncbi:1-acyl-sn-glycerol-3-phosphate acyltransferase [Helicobacter sp. MIT 14-3879]|nr:1-acyl-sn-glycerol-3-phosphate acyltransferase [Helicobacter sp. MIT 14-3879]
MLSKLRGLWATISTGIILPLIILSIYIFRPINRPFRKTSKIFFFINGIKIERIGEFDKDAKILVLNHQGMMDIAYLEAYYPWDICWVAKKELGDIFLYGHALKAPKMILIDRDDKKSLIYLLKEAKKKLNEGRILAIFPEGTRSKGGENLLPFKNGAKILIEKYNLKIQPIVLVNTRNLFDTSKLEIRSNKAKAICMDAFIPDFTNRDWYEKLRYDMQKTYTKYYNEIN